jgi:hypothetical protein
MLLPVLLAGFPYVLSDNVKFAEQFLKSGAIPAGSAKLLVVILSFFHPLLSWQNMIGWTALSVFFFVVALIPWWLAVRKLCDERIAWLSTVVLGFLPQYWGESLELSGYSLALFFLFLGFAVFLYNHGRRPLLAVILCGACMGAMIASRDAFATLLPWFVVGYGWHMRKNWKKGVLHVAVFILAFYVAAMSPLLINASRPGLTMQERVAMFFPTERNAGEEHLYPDDYTFTHLRPEFDAMLKERAKQGGFFGNLEDEHYRMIFGVSDVTFPERIINGFWLFLNVLPAYFNQESVGGVFIWLFVIIGGVVLWTTRRILLVHLLGMLFSMEFLIRFVLHYARPHLNDVGWVLALLAGIGMWQVITSLRTKWPKAKPALLAALLCIVLSIQMMQSTRKFLADRYKRSTVPAAYAAAELLKTIPQDAMIAHPRMQYLFFFAGQPRISLHQDTIDLLVRLKRLKDPFAEYKVVYILGYDAEHAALITKAVPKIKVLTLPENPPSVPLTPFVRFLLNALH